MTHDAGGPDACETEQSRRGSDGVHLVCHRLRVNVDSGDAQHLTGACVDTPCILNIPRWRGIEGYRQRIFTAGRSIGHCRVTLKERFSTASAVFAGGAVAIGVVPAPTLLWLPREFDDSDTRLSQVAASLEAVNTTMADAAADAQSVAENAQSRLHRFDASTLAIAYSRRQALEHMVWSPTLRTGAEQATPGLA